MKTKFVECSHISLAHLFFQVVNKLSYYYKSVDDVDLYVGGVAERHIKDSYLGPTWWCIVGHQFQVWKRGDRFFYTHGGMPHSFPLGMHSFSKLVPVMYT